MTTPATPTAAEDRAGLIDLVCAVAEALDRRSWDRLANCFTDDADGYGAHGSEQIVAQVRTYLDNCGPTQHLVSNHRVTLAGDRARVTSKARVFHRAAVGPASYEVFGVYLDDAVHTDDGWRLCGRTFVAEIELGDIAVILGSNAPRHQGGGLVDP